MIFVEYLLAIIIGISAGIITGLIPGIHINLISLLLLSSAPLLLGYASLISVMLFIVSMSITHTFLDAIPGIYLGAPDPDMAMGVLPGHKMLLEGRGYAAVKLTIIGSILSLAAIVMITPLLIYLIPSSFDLMKDKMGYILLLIVIWMIFQEKRRFMAAAHFLAAGMLGILVISMHIKNPLFPLLSGLFGVSTLALSIKDKVKIPKQVIEKELKIKRSVLAKIIPLSALSGALVGLLPGVGSAQAAAIGGSFSKDLNNDHMSFLIMVGGINTANMLTSLIALYTLGKARNGAVIVMQKLMTSINSDQLLLFITASVIVGGIASLLTLFFAKRFSDAVTKVNYKKLCLGIIFLISLLTIVLSGWRGVLILIISSFAGMIPQLTGIRRSNSMGCLLLPVILWSLL